MIEELLTSKDGEVRAATVRTASGKLLNRALSFLYPLECSEVRDKPANPEKRVLDSGKQDDADNQKNECEHIAKRLTRAAAIEARRKLNKLLNT